MQKQLKSGLEVDSDEYYAVLEWKDTYPGSFTVFVHSHFGRKNGELIELEESNSSINSYTREEYQALLKHIDSFMSLTTLNKPIKL